MVELDFHEKWTCIIFGEVYDQEKLIFKWCEFLKTHWVNFLLETNRT
jgi:hypothetical protein